MLARDKHSSILRKFVNYGLEKFYNIVSRLSAGTKSGLRSNFFEEDEDEEPYRPKKVRDVDSTYSDPLGPAPERPRTSAGHRGGAEDEFGDDDIGDDLLPE
jgi:hypothetical protein